MFQLLPIAPYHVLDLGGGTVAAGLFLGLLTYASALSAPFTGAIGDRLGQRRVLIAVSVVLAGITASYAIIQDHRLLLGVVVIHGVFWSALLAASGAYMTSTIPPSRRARGWATGVWRPCWRLAPRRRWGSGCTAMAGWRCASNSLR